jgi:hypothetical protein
MLAAGEASAETVRQEGDAATVTVTAGANTLTLQMTQVEGEWLIADLEEQAG